MNNTVTEYLKQEAFTLIISLNAVMRDTCRQWTGDNLLVNTGSQAVSSAPDGFCPTLAEPLQIYISTRDLIDGGRLTDVEEVWLNVPSCLSACVRLV